VTALDTGGHPVTLPRPARRIASLAPGFTEILFELGCGDRVILRDRWSDHPVSALGLPAVDGLEPSAAVIAGYDPDLVLLCFENPRHRSELERLGIPLAMMEPRTFEDVAADVKKLGRLCGQPQKGVELSERMRGIRREVQQAARGLERPLVYVEIDGSDPSRPWTAGPGSFIDELLAIAGARNAAADASSRYAQVSAEAIVRSDPDVILLLDVDPVDPEASVARLRERAGWGNVPAIRNRRIIHRIDKDLLSRPSTRLAQGLQLLFEALHDRQQDGGAE